MADENKVVLYAPISVDKIITEHAKEQASVLVFPEERQQDLQYIRSILVSAGTNKNGAHFLPSEMMKSHNTIVNKAIDIEHDESRVIGHIYECAFLFKNGEFFDPQQLLAEYTAASNSPDDLDIDVVVAGVIHKMRFPDISEEIAKGEWKVSMECYFKDFDIKIGNTIINRQEAEALGYNPQDLLGGFVKVMAGTKELGKHFVSRVLRGITFSGMGIVKNPANPHSIILETAAIQEKMAKADRVIDLEQIDNLRGHKIEVSNVKDLETPSEGEQTLEVKVVTEEGEVASEQLYVEVDKETGGIKRILSVTSKEAASLRYNGPGIGGPGSIAYWPDELCKSFKKRLTKFNALDQSEAVVIHEHWCALFEEPCPVIGASAKAPECLRNQRNQVTKDPVDTTITKSIREHLDSAPSNTFTTVLQSTKTSSAERQEQVSRIRSQAQELRKNLQSFVAAEKKSSK